MGAWFFLLVPLGSVLQLDILVMGATLQLHDDDPNIPGTVEFEPTGAATLVGNEHSINVSVNLVVGQNTTHSPCALGTESVPSGAPVLKSSCPAAIAAEVDVQAGNDAPASVKFSDGPSSVTLTANFATSTVVSDAALEAVDVRTTTGASLAEMASRLVEAEATISALREYNRRLLMQFPLPVWRNASGILGYYLDGETVEVYLVADHFLVGGVEYSEAGSGLAAANLSLSSSGVLRGTLPSPSERSPGLLYYPFRVVATDALLRTIERNFSIVTANFQSADHFETLLNLYGAPSDAPTWITPPGDLGTYVHEAYHKIPVEVANFSAHIEYPLRFEEVGDALAAAGLAVHPNNGTIFGTLVTIPPGQVTYTFVLRVTDGLDRSALRSFSITSTTNTPPYYVSPDGNTNDNPHLIGEIYHSGRSFFGHLRSLLFQDPEAAAGQTLSYSVVSGALPSGMSLGTDGVLMGEARNVTTDTTYAFAVVANDGIAASASVDFEVSVLAPKFADLCENAVTPGSCETRPNWNGGRGGENPAENTPGPRSGQWVAPINSWSGTPVELSVEILVVGAGGSPGIHGEGAAGAGAIVHHTGYPVVGSVAYDFKIGGVPWDADNQNYLDVAPLHGVGESSIFDQIEAKGGGPGGTTTGGANGGVNGNNGGSCRCCRAHLEGGATRLVSVTAGGTAYEGHNAGGRWDGHYEWGDGGAAGAGGDGVGAWDTYESGSGNTDCGSQGRYESLRGGPGVYFENFHEFGEEGWFAGGKRGSQGFRHGGRTDNYVGHHPRNGNEDHYPLTGNTGEMGWWFGGGGQPGTIIIRY